MKIIHVDDYYEMSKRAAEIVSNQLKLKPDSVLGLATGDTPLGMYRELIKKYKGAHIDFSKVKTFNLDEYCNLNKNNKQSYSYYMRENFFKHINISRRNINIPNGMAKDITKETFEYERKIINSGGIDLQILGIGTNGHIGFNEPQVKFEALTHMVNLDKQTIRDNARFFNSIEEVPTKAISMGIKTIMHARKIILLASGIKKAHVVYKSIYGEIKPTMPASVLQLHQNVICIVDKEASSKLYLNKSIRFLGGN